MEKQNFFSRLINNIKAIWDRLGEEDVPVEEKLGRAEAEELKGIKAIEAEFHEKNKFVPKAKVNEGKANSATKGKTKAIKDEKILGDA